MRPIRATPGPPTGSIRNSWPFSRLLPAGSKRLAEAQMYGRGGGCFGVVEGGVVARESTRLEKLASRSLLKYKQCVLIATAFLSMTHHHPIPRTPRQPGVPRVCLVHGPFGSGKSTLLVTLLRFLLKARGVAGGPLAGARILVASGTNVAVDRVLLGLLDAGCSDFLRVGSVRRMDARLLPHSLHASSSKTSGLAELKRALQETTDAGDRQALREEIARLEAGEGQERVWRVCWAGKCAW